MVKNLGRKVTLVLFLLVAAAASIAIAGFRLGLDLQGGTRLVYSVNFDKALEDGTITQAEFNDKRGLINQMISIWKERIDPQGVREPIVRPEGDERIVIELPGSASEVRKAIVGTLSAEVQPGTSTLNLAEDDDELLRSFPSGGGIVEIDHEKIHYRKRQENVLMGATRGYAGTAQAAHAAGSDVQLKNTDPWRDLIENVGDLRFYIEAKPSDFLNEQTDLQAERAKLDTWLANNPDATEIDAFNNLPAADGGPVERLKWYPMEQADGASVPLAQRLQPLIIQEDPAWRFSGEDLRAVYQSQDQLGFPAVGFEMATSKREAFGDFTGEHENERMAIVINDEIVTFPSIDERLPGRGIITGGVSGFTVDEVQALVTVLRSGSLKIKPELEHQERVGATLGDDYVKRGAMSALIGLVLVLAFMMFYYRRLGIFAALSLLANLILLMGAMAFMQATLTLPGVAGIILTVGMAVDANILIYERIREEAERGRKPAQAAKDGFANALSTIVDANLTTLITAFILKIFGTGPVKGFANTLSIGILTSMFSALVITRILIHIQLEKGIDAFSMARLIHATKIRFMARAKLAATASLTLIVAGVALFATVPANEKYGIDFLGGVTMNVRTQEPQPVQLIRDRVAAIEGIIGDSSEVKAILSSEADGGFREFRITFKTEGSGSGEQSDATQALKDTVETEVRGALEGVLERGPFELTVDATDVNGTLYFEKPHAEADLAAHLSDCGIADPTVTRVTGPAAGYAFHGTIGLDKDTQAVSDLVQNEFTGKLDSTGVEFSWAEPIPEIALVGAQVVSEIRDKAIFAIILSLFAAVMYIRVRFAEYSYGLAAVIALVHDVLITLGVLALAIKFDLIEAEINLPMIAAFLTIIGYSLNDTIVVFDRIRENLPRMKGSFSEIIDASINQTLSRTLLTSLTTLMSVVVLLAFNYNTRNVLEGFAFALTIGVVVGTYSSMYVACPVLHWLETRRRRRDGEPTGTEAKSESKAKAQVQTT